MFNAILAGVLAAAQASSQQSPVVSISSGPQQAVILTSDAGNILRAGTEVTLQIEEGLDSNDKTVTEGQKFRLAVTQDVKLGNVVVIPQGSPATGEIIELRRKGMWGKSGRIVARILNVRVGDRVIRLTGKFDDKGTTGTAGVVGSLIVVPFAGFFMTGTSAKVLPGSQVRAFLDEDLRIAVPQLAPITAPAVAAAPVPAQ